MEVHWGPLRQSAQSLSDARRQEVCFHVPISVTLPATSRCVDRAKGSRGLRALTHLPGPNGKDHIALYVCTPSAHAY